MIARPRVWIVVTLVLLYAGTVAPVMAQEATPELPSLPPEVEGIVGAAIRDFEVSSTGVVGTVALSALVVEFEDSNAAAAAFSPFIEFILARMRTDASEIDADASAVRPASARSLGDETTALAGEVRVTDPDEAIDSFTLATVFVRRDALLFAVRGAAFVGDPLTDALNLVEKIIDRERGVGERDPRQPSEAYGRRSDGLWGMLPMVEDLPDGFVFDEERTPEWFEAPQITVEGEGDGETEPFVLRPGTLYITLVYPTFAPITIYLLSPYEDEPLLLHEGRGVGPYNHYFFSTDGTVVQTGRYALRVEAEGEWTITIEQ